MSLSSPTNREIVAPPHDRAARRHPINLGEVASRLFRQRQSFASKLLGDGKITRDEADAKLRPWLAIASAAGADLPQLIEPAARIFPDYNPDAGHRLRSDEICPRGQWHEALAQARDAAIRRHGEEPGDQREHAARELLALCNALGVAIPFKPKPETQGEQ